MIELSANGAPKIPQRQKNRQPNGALKWPVKRRHIKLPSSPAKQRKARPRIACKFFYFLFLVFFVYLNNDVGNLKIKFKFIAWNA